jgi:hypothetical protein
MNASRVTIQTVDASPGHGTERYGTRYSDMTDRRLATKLLAEDAAEDAGLDPFERISCRIHRRWLHQCVHSPVHVVMVSGYRWCRSCEAQATVAVDELTGDIRVTCPQCGQTPSGRASQQIVRTCTASLAAAQDLRPCRLPAPPGDRRGSET